MRPLLPCLLLAACHAPAPVPHAGEPPRIDVACVVRAEDALCTFQSHGGPGERCVRVLLGGRRVPVAVAVADTCSGRIGHGETRSLPARFARPPSELCGTHLPACTLEVAEPAAAEAVAAAFADRVAAAQQGGPPDVEECQELVTHWIDLSYNLRVRDASPEEVAAADEWRQAALGDTSEHVDFCSANITRGQLDCGMRARTLTEFESCK